MLNIWLLGLTVSSFLMLVVWLIAVGIRNAGIVDIAWSGGFSLLAWLYFSFANGWLARKLLILGMASFWSLRLAGHLYRRVMGHHPKEDDRYADYRRLWGESFNIKMFGFFQIQALLLWVQPALPAGCAKPGGRLSCNGGGGRRTLAHRGFRRELGRRTACPIRRVS